MNQTEMKLLLTHGRAREWNHTREQYPGWQPDLEGLDLSEADLFGRSRVIETVELGELEGILDEAAQWRFNLDGANLCGVKMPPLPAGYERYEDSPFLFVAVTRDDDFAPGPGWVNAIAQIPSVSGAIYDAETTAGFDLMSHGAIIVTELDRDHFDRLRHSKTFISYAWADEKVVTAIDAWLRANGIRTTIDRRDFFAGSRIRDEIARVMSACDVVVLFYAEQASGKPWVEFESELAADLMMEARKEGRPEPRLVYICLDDTPLPSVSQRSRIAVMAKGRTFSDVCEEIRDQILRTPRRPDEVDLSAWDSYRF